MIQETGKFVFLSAREGARFLLKRIVAHTFPAMSLPREDIVDNGAC